MKFEKGVVKMGLAPGQRDELSISKSTFFAALVPVQLSRRANRVDDSPQQRGQAP